jgi:hypothetical protein
LGACIAPVGKGKAGAECLTLRLEAGEHSGALSVPCGELGVLPLPCGAEGMLHIECGRGFELGQGRGRSASVRVKGGVVGVIADARGRPLAWPKEEERAAAVQRWQRALQAYPE